ncbi:MAG: hypothetical protein R3230_01980 [Nitrosopumilaceae archaeon]|nr:hypothetical protein [Nitrosopumilaceae archaeon]
MVLTAVGGMVALVVTIVSVMVFAITYDKDDYWENQKLIEEVQDKNLSLESSRVEIFKAYSVGELTLDEAITEMNTLLDDAVKHVNDIEEDVKFLTVSHNFRNAKNIVASIEKDLEFLEAIKE